MTDKAIILLSGGLDSTTLCAYAKNQGYELYALSFEYGQRHVVELLSAKMAADQFGVREHKVMPMDLRLFGGSALTDDIAVPKDSNLDQQQEIPITYVPARNTIFLSFALGYAEVIGAYDIFIGANAVDYSGYPDCRPAFIEAFSHLANVATEAGVTGKGKYIIHAPLINKTKADIIALGQSLGVDYSKTISCYDPSDTGLACGECDACRLRKKGFADAGIADPTLYATKAG